MFIQQSTTNIRRVILFEWVILFKKPTVMPLIGNCIQGNCIQGHYTPELTVWYLTNLV